MVVRTIKARKDRRTGDIAVTFTICPKTWVNIKEEAEDCGFFGVTDFIAGVINAQLVGHEPARPNQGPPEPPYMDDDIPF